MLSHKLRRYKSGPTTDSNFKQTVLLLHGDGTNGGQNNSFVDGSSNNATVTRNGNTTQGTFSPFIVGASEWSNFFDGNGDYLRPATNAGLSFDADFTIEMWAMSSSSLTQYAQLFASGSVDMGIAASRNFSNTYSVHSVGGNINSGVTSNDGLWHHLALVRSGSTITFYVDGVSKGTTTSSSTFDFGSATAAWIGSRNAFDNHYQGYISNLRVVKGTAVYTADFTVPTAPLTAITNTQLLTCRTNRFIDSSSNNLTMTRTGDVRVRPFSPFAPTVAYSSSTNGSSIYVDGTGDTLTGASNTALSPGTGAFTFETWFYVVSFPFDAGLMQLGTQSNGLQIGRRDSGAADWGVAQAAVAWRLTSTTLPTVGQWNHMVVVRDGSNNMSLFLNGTRLATTTTSYTFTQGGFTCFSKSVGWFSDTRYVVGTAVYDPTSTSLTVPTAPLTAITNTQLLLQGANAAIIDNTGKTVLETLGNAQLDTGTKKFGTASLEFDGNGDYLVAPYTPDIDLLPGTFTIEAWVYATTLSADRRIFSTGGGTVGWNSTNGIHVLFQVGSTGVLNVQLASGTSTPRSFSTTATVSLNTWTHVALVYDASSTTVRLFIDGTMESSSISAPSRPSTNPVLNIASIPGEAGISTQAWTGFIDDLRVTKGVARYSASFTVPSSAYPDNS